MPVNSLFVFAKPNRFGVSKTRLARDIGPVEAARVNSMSTSRVLKAVIDPRWQTALSVAPDLATESRQPLWPGSLPRIPQGGGDLGDRLTRAYNLAPTGNVIFIGTDMPDLNRHDIWAACKALRRTECVIGPAEDGGFWLIGLNKRTGSHPPFDNVRWSSADTLKDVERNLGPARPVYLETRRDIDDGEDWLAWKQLSNRGVQSPDP